MTIITAVELRKNMGEIFRRVAAGEEIAVTYRGGKQFVIAQKDVGRKRTTLDGLERLLSSRPQGKSQLDPNKTFKELYHKYLDEKYARIQRELHERQS